MRKNQYSKRILILIVVGILLVPVIFYVLNYKDTIVKVISFSNPSPDRIIYTRDYAWKGYKNLIYINSNRKFEYITLDFKTNQEQKRVTGELTSSEYKVILNTISKCKWILMGNKDLSNPNICDASEEFIQIELGTDKYKCGGYGVEDKQFRDYVQHLYNIIDKYLQEKSSKGIGFIVS